MPTHNISFKGSSLQVEWQGNRVSNREEFIAYLRNRVNIRLQDGEFSEQFESDLSALATTGMATETLENLLSAAETERQPWEIGEALAECLLEDYDGAKWPWNTERDKKTPKASLPGADLVGFIEDGEGICLLIGEVKTSQDTCNPPGVMTGRSGMSHQIDNLANNLGIHYCILKWLAARCKNTDMWSHYQEAAEKYLKSGGHAVMLTGALMRDTDPQENDLKNRAESLANSVIAPTKVKLTAWYLPTSISDLPSLTEGDD